ncbi:hypothetical protein [Streptomyces sp. LS1784]|uniref:hypothetical protein n=1 Tax=Streptomyces sp. LS1784 TaxID=2851533 RepID=UPI001CCE55C6|nr:hypothetical protein [Streptomyces sp. LS1784]
MHHPRNPDPLFQLHEAVLDFSDLEDGEPRKSVFAEVAFGKAELRPPYRRTVDGCPLPPVINSSYLEQS